MYLSMYVVELMFVLLCMVVKVKLPTINQPNCVCWSSYSPYFYCSRVYIVFSFLWYPGCCLCFLLLPDRILFDVYKTYEILSATISTYKLFKYYFIYVWIKALSLITRNIKNVRCLLTFSTTQPDLGNFITSLLYISSIDPFNERIDPIVWRL
jgi:hypothetical protein